MTPACVLFLFLAATGPAWSEDGLGGKDVDLLAGGGFSAFRTGVGEWFAARQVTMDPSDPKKLTAQRTEAAVGNSGVIIVNGSGKTNNLTTRASFGDCQVEVEFLIPKGSNAGVKLHGHYEIQIFDSWGARQPKGTDCGGIYPRAELIPHYHHIDSGVPPLVNACKPPGEWQFLLIQFRAPRFDAAGDRLKKAAFTLVQLNGQTIQQNVELNWPTGHAWRNRETLTGPILIQADHGPVAFRKVLVRGTATKDGG